MTRPLPATGRDLTGDELAQLALDLAALPELWRRHVHHDPRQRTFHEMTVSPYVSVWLICWMPGHDTGFHDHDGSGGAVAVIQGEVREERLRVGGPPAWTVAGPGELLRFAGPDIHRVLHHGAKPAVTIHAYSPVLRRMGAYVLDEEGRLLRHALDEGTELKLTAAAG
jgi:predicted metal-dependent enzyme (double-stranded beta helix superfamily)